MDIKANDHRGMFTSRLFVHGSVSVPLPTTDRDPEPLPEPDAVPPEVDSLVVSRLLVVARESLLDSVMACLKRQATEGIACKRYLSIK